MMRSWYEFVNRSRVYGATYSKVFRALIGITTFVGGFLLMGYIQIILGLESPLLSLFAAAGAAMMVNHLATEALFKPTAMCPHCRDGLAKSAARKLELRISSRSIECPSCGGMME